MLRDFLGKINKILPIRHASYEVPLVLQMEATECGAASLAMILAYYGQWVPLEKLRQECGVNRDGSKAGCIMRAARKRNCDVHGFQTTADKLREKKIPIIIHWEFNHFVVLEGIEDDVAYISDPAHGKRQIPWEEFRTSFTGISIEITPGDGFKKEGAPYSIVAALKEKLMQDRWAVLFVVLIGLAMIFPGLASPVFTQIYLDDILSFKNHGWMFNLTLAMLASLLLTGVLTALKMFILTRWQQKLTISGSSRFFWHALRLPMDFYHQRYAAEVASRISFNESVAAVLSGEAATAVLELVVAIFYLLLLLQYNWKLTCIGVFFSALNFLVFKVLNRRITDMNMRVQQYAGKEYGTLVNGMATIESLKANGTEADFFAKWLGYHTKVMAGTQEARLWSSLLIILPLLFNGFNTAFILTFGSISVIDGLMTTGVFMAFRSLMDSFNAPVEKLMNLGSTLQETEMQMRRLDDIMRYPVDSLNYPEKAPEGFKGYRLSGDLELVDVSFGYSPLSPPLIERVNLHVRPGQQVAIVGFSGCGKSTLARIVTGLYEEWSGEVRFDGVKRRDIPRDLITRAVASVDQETFQISGTVMENITLFDKSISKSDVIMAAQDACIHDDIIQLDGAYEAAVSEGGMNFSGGQRQRLEIARALATNPSILVLDEATSALDAVTEQRVLDNIRHRGCSCFMIAHRLSTIRDCDEIIVLDHGKVVERGAHNEMMAHDGPYRTLIEEQSRENV